MKVNFYLDTSLDSQGEAKILVSICTKGVRYQSSTGWKCLPGYWNRAEQRVRAGAITRRGIEAAEINVSLDEIASHFENLATGSAVTVEWLKDEFHTLIGRTTVETPMSIVEFRESLGRQIVQTRSQLGLTQEDLAARSGLSRHSVVTIENGSVGASIDSYLKVLSSIGRTFVVTACDE